MVVEESQSSATGGWGAVVRETGSRRVAVATADIVEMSRSEPSPKRYTAVVIGVLLGLVGAVLILVSISAKDY
jgi:capsular polysaccharide biosynthesis protein